MRPRTLATIGPLKAGVGLRQRADYPPIIHLRIPKRKSYSAACQFKLGELGLERWHKKISNIEQGMSNFEENDSTLRRSLFLVRNSKFSCSQD
jgi:hypothetical protein